MKIHVFDSLFFENQVGHHYNQNKGFEAQIEKRGLETEFYFPENVGQKNAEAFKAKKIFLPENTVEISRDPMDGILDNFFAFNDLHYQSLSRLDKNDFAPNDVIVYHTMAIIHLQGLARWLAEFDPDKMPYVFLLIPNPFTDDVFQPMFTFHCFSQLPNNDKIFLSSDNSDMTSVYQKYTDKTVHNMPIPVFDENSLQKYTSSKLNIKKRIGFLGYGSHDKKGNRFLPSVIRQILEKHDVTFFVQHNPCKPKDVEKYALFKNDERVTVHYGDLEEEEYFDILAGLDITLMPYSPVYYKTSSSGVFVESVAFGKVMVLPGNTWLEKETRRFDAGATFFEHQSVSDIASALDVAIENFDVLSKRSQHASEAFCKYHNVSNFVDEMFKIMNIQT